MTTTEEMLLARIEALFERQKKQQELIDEMMPIAKSAMSVMTEKLDALERRGYFAFGREAASVLDRVVTGFSPEDLRQLGDNIVSILKTVRSVTQPKVLQMMSEASEVVESAENEGPVGMFGALRATRDEDVQRGLGVLLAVLREVGRSARHVERERVSGRDRLAARLAPTGVPPPVPRGPPAPARPKPVAVSVIDGVALDAEGFLVDPDAWNHEVALKMAHALGIPELTERHWAVLDYARATFLESGQSPNVRKLVSGTGLSTKEVYALFKKAPGLTAARIAGVPKPVGCI